MKSTELFETNEGCDVRPLDQVMLTLFKLGYDPERAPDQRVNDCLGIAVIYGVTGIDPHNMADLLMPSATMDPAYPGNLATTRDIVHHLFTPQFVEELFEPALDVNEPCIRIATVISNLFAMDETFDDWVVNTLQCSLDVIRRAVVFMLVVWQDFPDVAGRMRREFRLPPPD